MSVVAGNCRVMIFPIIPRSTFLILQFLLLLFFTSFISYSSARKSSTSNPANSLSSCPPSSCGNIRLIKYPFRLKTDPESCGRRNDPDFVLDCQNNHTILTIHSKRYFVQEINYKKSAIRIAYPGVNKENLSSCPLYSIDINDLGESIFQLYYSYRLNPFDIAFIHCLSPVNSVKYVEAPLCGNKTSILYNSIKSYSFVSMYDERRPLDDLEDSCTLDVVFRVSANAPIMKDNPSLPNIYDALAYGCELSWRDSDDISLLGIIWWITKTSIEFSIVTFVGMAALKFVIGFPLLIWLVVRTWRRRHLSVDKTIEEFLQGQHNLAPIMYSYSEIKKMTTNFKQKLGEGGYGTVYKGKLRSGPYIAIKMMEQSTATEEEFINEVGTIGRIHHVNIVQLIGFCVERSKYALVYEFLPNGSLDRYIFNQQSLGVLTMTLDKIFEIALGVARGIDYLHHGCCMQILHFDIKPHNILLDEKLHPKISDFGLARLHSIDESFVNLTVARGTVGYMAPEMFYRNFGGISSKADVYSFGMMLMELISRRKNINPFAEDMSQMNFPSWVYNQLCAEKDINITDATEEERLVVKKIIIVALWCIQMRPSDCPSMNKVIDMLEGDSKLEMPPKPFVAPHEVTTRDHEITRTYSVDYINLDLAEN